MPTFVFIKDGRQIDSLQGAEPNGLQRLIERHAPKQGEISFAGAGHQLGDSSSEAGPPKVNWDSPAAQDEINRRREAMAAAAAQRYSKPAAPAPTPEEPKNEEPRAGAEGGDAATGTVAAAPAPSGAADGGAAAAAASSSAANDARLKVDQNLLNQLLEMGFTKVRAEKSLILSGNKSLEASMDWIFQHQEDADIDEPLVMVTEDGVAKPVLSEEERKKRANEALLRVRKKREEEDRKAEHDRERNRIRSGKEITEAKRKHEENERKRAIEAKRKEKLAAAAEKKRVQELVAADRAARREKFGKKPSGDVPAAAPAPVQAASKPAARAAPPTGGKLQLRFSDGTRAEQHFELEHTLNDVIDAVVREKPSVAKSAIRLATMYPRRTFQANDYEMTLVDLKLLPRGVLNVTI